MWSPWWKRLKTWRIPPAIWPRASKIYHQMLSDKNCSVILCIAGSLISAGLKKIIVDMIQNKMVDAIVSNGANIVDQDFFEALGYKHYLGSQHNADDNLLRDLHIDRIYDTYINEDELKECDETVHKICNSLEPRPYSSREFIWEMGKWLEKNKKGKDSVVYNAYKYGVPIFVPAFSDCSAGFGFVAHQTEHPTAHVSIDSAKDFLELTKIKIKAKETGLMMFSRRRTEELCPGYRGGGRNFGCGNSDAQIRRANHRGRRARRRALSRLYAQRSLQLGQSVHRAGTNGIRRMHHADPADYRIRLS